MLCPCGAKWLHSKVYHRENTAASARESFMKSQQATQRLYMFSNTKPAFSESHWSVCKSAVGTVMLGLCVLQSMRIYISNGSQKQERSLLSRQILQRSLHIHPAWDKCWVLFCPPDFNNKACYEQLLDPWGLNLGRSPCVDQPHSAPEQNCHIRYNMNRKIQTMGT